MLRTLLFSTLTALAVAAEALAGGPIPAVDLPAAVPDSVRDQTARALASNRDTLSWVVHPFRGEFHGLGGSSGGSSAAYDLSANGRVVVGADINGTGGSEAFVWSPWTGRATYNMRPAGVTGGVTATTISADGVYVAGNVTNYGSPYSGDQPPTESSAFRWSLAGRESIPAPAGKNLGAASISGNGAIVVGEIIPPPVTVFAIPPTPGDDVILNNYVFPDEPSGTLGLDLTLNPAFASPIPDAYRYTRSGGVQLLESLEGFGRTSSVDISANGQIILGNVSPPNFYAILPGMPIPETQPVLWRDGEATAIGGLSRPGFPRVGFDPSGPYVWPQYSQSRTTTANALSADGSTVVGVEVLTRSSIFTDTLSSFEQAAILWREVSGWIDLGELKTSAFQFQTSAAAIDVSADGSLVIGESGISTPCLVCDCLFGSCGTFKEVPFLWDEQRGMRELVDVLRLDYGLGFDGWSLGEATAISDDGTTIIGNGTNPAGGEEAWRAVLQRSTPHGDLDFDGDIDHLDYQMLAANLGIDSATDAVFYASGDLNADGRVDGLDAAALRGVYQHRWMGDFNADGLVDLADYTLWRDHQGLFTGGLADSNGDGWVNQADLAAWHTHYGMAVSAVLARSVPEPSGLALAFGVLLATRPRRTDL